MVSRNRNCISANIRSSTTTRYAWHAHLLLMNPRRVDQTLRRLAQEQPGVPTPNLWQIELGVLSMWHRVLFRSDTVGTSKHQAPRANWRAKLLQSRPLRFPFLLWEKAVAPLDFSGLASPPERIISHLLGAHHDGQQFAYDLELLALHPGYLEEALTQARELTARRSCRSEWLRDLVVFDGYHERLEAALRGALEGDLGLSQAQANDADISLSAYLRWCAKQPLTPADTITAWKNKRLNLWRTTGEQV